MGHGASAGAVGPLLGVGGIVQVSDGLAAGVAPKAATVPPPQPCEALEGGGVALPSPIHPPTMGRHNSLTVTQKKEIFKTEKNTKKINFAKSKKYQITHVYVPPIRQFVSKNSFGAEGRLNLKIGTSGKTGKVGPSFTRGVYSRSAL